MHKKYIAIIIFFIPTLLFISCYKVIQEPLPDGIQLQPNLAIPLISADLTIEKSLVLVGEPTINLDIKVPKWAQFPEIFFRETLPFAFSDIQNVSEAIRYLEFNISIWNDFASSAEIQVKFIDEESAEIDSLFFPRIEIVNAQHNIADGTVLKRGYSNSSIPFTPERIENIRRATQVALIGKIINTDVPVVLFDYYLNYKLTVIVSARTGIDYTFD